MKHALGVLFLTLCLLAMPAMAEKGRFFEALYDVPVMPGLEELPDQAMLFDKPDGRIASVVAASKTLEEADIKSFYKETLSQMGWKKDGQNQYVRGLDRLSMEIVKRPPLTLVHFTLEPASP
jgi:hypothetical protein